MVTNNETIHLALSGSKGRMGQCIQEVVAQNSDYLLSAEFFRGQSDGERGQALQNPIDVWIDFSNPIASLVYCELCRKNGWKMVMGTTGFSDAQKGRITEAAKDIPIVFAPNMSIGNALMLKILTILGQSTINCDVGIIDVHHKHKKDAPSGTALAMAKVINGAKPTGSMHADIISLRLGESIGEHQVLFALKDESINITHTVHDRKVFAEGVLKAVAWLMNIQKPGLYGMQDVLSL